MATGASEKMTRILISTVHVETLNLNLVDIELYKDVAIHNTRKKTIDVSESTDLYA